MESKFGTSETLRLEHLYYRRAWIVNTEQGRGEDLIATIVSGVRLVLRYAVSRIAPTLERRLRSHQRVMPYVLQVH